MRWETFLLCKLMLADCDYGDRGPKEEVLRRKYATDTGRGGNVRKFSWEKQGCGQKKGTWRRGAAKIKAKTAEKKALWLEEKEDGESKWIQRKEMMQSDTLKHSNTNEGRSDEMQLKFKTSINITYTHTPRSDAATRYFDSTHRLYVTAIGAPASTGKIQWSHMHDRSRCDSIAFAQIVIR